MAAAEERVDLTTVSDDELHKRLEDKTRQARRLLDTLLEDNPGLEDEYCLKPEVIKNCEAVAFLDFFKAGIALTVGRGHGFILRKLDGGARWSSPVFFDITQFGLGTSIGVSWTDGMLVFSNAAAAAKLCEGKVQKFGADLLLWTAGSGGMPNDTYGATRTLDKPADARLYAVAEALMLFNLAFIGTEMKLDVATNKKLYGDAKPTDVLAGNGPHFNEMALLTTKLTGLCIPPEPVAAPATAAEPAAMETA